MGALYKFRNGKIAFIRLLRVICLIRVLFFCVNLRVLREKLLLSV